VRPSNNRDKTEATQPLSPCIDSVILGQIGYVNMLQQWQKKESGSHFYMCWTEYDGNCRNSLMHTPDRPPYIGLEGLFIIAAFLVKAVLIDIIIPLLSKKLSIVFEGSILFSPSVVARSVATKQSREANEIAMPRLVGSRNDNIAVPLPLWVEVRGRKLISALSFGQCPALADQVGNT
jgi:hypothetical protein